MDKQRVIELAIEAGFNVGTAPQIERFAALIEAEMRGDAEPVAWLNKDGVIVGHDEGGSARPLYLHPAPAKWDASAPLLLNDGRMTRFADGSIGIGTPSSETLMFMPQPPTEEILNVSKSGVFTWHPDADKLIEEVQYNPALQHILRVLRKATND